MLVAFAADTVLLTAEAKDVMAKMLGGEVLSYEREVADGGVLCSNPGGGRKQQTRAA